MHDPAVVEAALKLLGDGLNDRQAAEALGIARRTVSDWRRAAERSTPAAPVCPSCWRRVRRQSTFTDSDYAELLGLYLGDGCLSPMGRTYALRISLDSGHPRIAREAADLLGRCFSDNRLQVVRVPGSAVLILQVYSNHLPCLFPQHGPGKKHERAIVLAPWQQEIVDRAPWSLIRGLFRSDGCDFINRTGIYEYLSYDFCNFSPDILDLFADTCASVGVVSRRYDTRVRIYRRDAVALMAAHAGVKE